MVDRKCSRQCTLRNHAVQHHVYAHRDPLRHFPYLRMRFTCSSRVLCLSRLGDNVGPLDLLRFADRHHCSDSPRDGDDREGLPPLSVMGVATHLTPPPSSSRSDSPAAPNTGRALLLWLWLCKGERPRLSRLPRLSIKSRYLASMQIFAVWSNR